MQGEFRYRLRCILGTEWKGTRARANCWGNFPTVKVPKPGKRPEDW